MTFGHAFWFLLVVACVAWYSTITIYVAIRGCIDIRGMLRDLQERDENANSETSYHANHLNS